MIVSSECLAAPGESLHGFMKLLAKGISRHAALLDSRKQAREAVHKIRTSSKRLRALLQLTSPALARTKRRAARTAVRRMKAAVASARDADVMADLLRRVSRAALETDLIPPTRRPSSARVMRLAADLEHRIDSLSVHRLKLSEALVRVCETYDRARREGDGCAREPLDDAMHSWRKRVKILSYQCEALSGIPALEPIAARAKALASALGEHHDLAVLENQIVKGKGARRRLLPGIAARKAVLTRLCLAKGSTLLRAETSSLAQRLQPALSSILEKKRATRRKAS